MKSMSLKKYWHIRMTVFVFICVVVSQLALFASFSNYGSRMTTKRQELYVDAIHDAALHDVQMSAEFIRDELRKISQLAYLLKLDHEHFFANIEGFSIPEDTSGYIVNENEKLVSVSGYDVSSLLYAVSNIDSELGYIKAYSSEQMDAVFKRIVKSSIYIRSVHFNSNDGLIRSYPYAVYTEELHKADLNRESFQFFNKAYEEYNPSGNHVWTDLYLDPAGNGWIVSCIVPIFSDGVLEGVSGIDIDINRIVERVLEENLSVESAAFITNESDELIAANSMAAALFSTDKEALFPENGVILGDLFSENIHSSMMDKELLRSIINDLPLDQEYTNSILIEGTDYFLSRIEIPETKWSYYTVISNEDLMLPLEALNEDRSDAYRALGVLLVVLNGLLLLLVYQVQQKFSKKLVSPIVQLSKELHKYDIDGALSFNGSVTGIVELDELKSTFNELIDHLDARTDRIVKIEKEKLQQEARIELLDEYSYKDALTGLDNRRRLEEILDVEIYRSMRYSETLATILLDIDDFKLINDTFGHDVGDDILKILVSEIGDNIRKSDYFCRWGGEEFQIVCPETLKDGAMMLAEKLRRIIEAKEFVRGIRLTASFGVAVYNSDGDDKFSMFKRADKAMYIAKEEGRNRVKFG